MAKELFRLQDAQVRIDGRIVLDIDDFSMHKGEHVVILGPNGSGKSTLIKLLTRELQPLWKEESSLLFNGKRNTSLEDINQVVGVVSSSFEDRMLVHRSALDIVLGGYFGSVGVPYRRAVTPEQDKAARQALRDIGLASMTTRDMRTLSTGQARRVLIARALINAPEVLVFDEPCVGLDVEAKWHLRESLSTLAQANRTMMLVTHDVADIVPEFDRVVILREGKIIADGPKEEVLTTAMLRRLFGVPVELFQTDGRYHLQQPINTCNKFQNRQAFKNCVKIAHIFSVH